ncbi:helix-turn-helix domain-containing protein [Kitasatospora sp. NPDC059599]|uniref:helix-turn-helix domain-containing protein n=1 Tax=Kitasatospora sp. NPDC059599 TaxID=3346880 RepID=UPI0036A98146
MELDDGDQSLSPAVRFGQELRRQRRARGWSQADLGKRMGYSHGLISYLEGAKKPVTRKFSVAADRVFGTDGMFVELWRRISNASLLEGFDEYVEAETRCRKIRTFALNVVPGLFQTETYATALASAAVLRGSITKSQAQERVDFLMGRQQVLHRDPPPTVHAVMDESCLLRPVGGRDVMLHQLRHLESLAELPALTLQVAPFTLGEHVPFTMPIVLLTLRDRSVVGYAESQARGIVERGRTAVEAWDSDYDQLQVESLSKVASLDLIRAARKDLE